MPSFRFILEPYIGKNSRYPCPSCKQAHQFTRYVDTNTGSYIADHVGVCNHVNKCGHHFTPKQYFQETPNITNSTTVLPFRGDAKGRGVILPTWGDVRPKRTEGSPSFITKTIFNNSLSNYNSNNLIYYLNTILDKQTVNHLINIYKIGTSSCYNGGTTIFWQIDMQRKIRTGKLIKYNPITGKRQKKPYVATNWIHSIHCQKEFYLVQCLFGEHLLAEDTIMPIALVESEKTAIIAQAKMPDYLWLATGSLNEFKASKLEVLRNRRVIAFPDLGAYHHWHKKAASLNFAIEVSDYLEKNATELQKKNGLDIADFLIESNLNNN